MKKLLFALTLVLCLAVSMVAFTSCGGNGEGDGETCEHIWATAATTDTPATCTTDGSESIKCLDCGETKEGSATAIPATGHDYTTESCTAATCNTDGSETKLCATCGDTITTTIPATGEHTWADIATNDVDATCTTDGSKSIKCTVCFAVKEGTTEVIPANHIWGIIPSMDTPPTCTETGVKSLKCIFCNEKQAGTEVLVPATGHSDVPVVVTPTFFSEGLAEGKCSACNEDLSYVVPKTEATMNPITSTTNNRQWVYASANVGEVIGDKNLYGEDGVDIFVEFSILLNDTMDMLANTNFTLPGIYKNDRLEGTNNGAGFYFLYIVEDWMAKGGFEIWNSRCNKVENGYLYGPDCDTTNLYVGNFDGWHRIGVQMHFEAFIENSQPYYVNTVTLYIDGVKVHSYKMRTDDDLSDQDVLTAINAIPDENGETIVDYENLDDRWVCVYRYTPKLKASFEGQTAYFPIADIFVTAGDGFVLNVTPVADPEAKTFTQDGVSLSGKMYYQLKTAE